MNSFFFVFYFPTHCPLVFSKKWRDITFLKNVTIIISNNGIKTKNLEFDDFFGENFHLSNLPITNTHLL